MGEEPAVTEQSNETNQVNTIIRETYSLMKDADGDLAVFAGSAEYEDMVSYMIVAKLWITKDDIQQFIKDLQDLMQKG